MKEDLLKIIKVMNFYNALSDNKEINQFAEEFANKKWVEVEKELPPSGMNVLLYSENGGVGEGAYHKGVNRFVMYRWSCPITATHWKYLPLFKPNK